METVFKEGDKVFCIIHGWGTVIKISKTGSFPILVLFTNNDGDEVTSSFTLDGRYFENFTQLLSFTENTLQGFSQERPIELPEVGELCLVRDYDGCEWKAVIFKVYYPNNEYPYYSERNIGYKQMKRIKILD
jgi:hypothetical protein